MFVEQDSRRAPTPRGRVCDRNNSRGSIPSNTHGKSVDWVITRNRDDANSVGHHDVFALASYAESNFL